MYDDECLFFFRVDDECFYRLPHHTLYYDTKIQIYKYQKKSKIIHKICVYKT
jgi:hypothetical protein